MHVYERSAAFFALGIAKKLQQPVALICTSGTGAANFLPACVAGALNMLYPHLTDSFGGVLNVGKKSEFKAALPHQFQANLAGVYHRSVARTYITHFAATRHSYYLERPFKSSRRPGGGSKTAMVRIGSLFTSAVSIGAVQFLFVMTAIVSNALVMARTIT